MDMLPDTFYMELQNFGDFPSGAVMRILHFKDRSQSVNTIFIQKVHFITSRSAIYEGSNGAKGGI